MICSIESWRPSDAEWSRTMDSIGATESARIARFQRPSPTPGAPALRGSQNADAKRSALGRLMLHRLAAAHLGVPRAFLTRTELGKPILDAAAHDADAVRTTHVSLAHDNAVVVAICRRVRCGVDAVRLALPRQEALIEFFDIYRDVFAPSEWLLIRGEQQQQQATAGWFDQGAVDRFFVLWALKESYVKATGDGIGFGLERIAFQFDDDDGANKLPCRASVRVDGIALPQWHFSLRYVVVCDAAIDFVDAPIVRAEARNDSPEHVFVIALCSENDESIPSFETMNWQSLI